MNLQLSIDIISLLMRVISVVIILLFVFPLMLKQSRVKDGLVKLRMRLLHYGIAFIILNIISAVLVYFRIVIDAVTYKNIIQFSTIIIGFIFLFLAWIGYKLYHEQYEEKSKKNK